MLSVWADTFMVASGVKQMDKSGASVAADQSRMTEYDREKVKSAIAQAIRK